MFMSFSFSNCFSYKDETVISFEPNKSSRLIEHIIKDGNNKSLKGNICFGANASGKTNLIKVLASLRNLIASNFKDKSKIKYFKINSNDCISQFKFKFSIDGEILFYELRIDFENYIILNEKLHNGKVHGVYFNREQLDSINVTTTKKISKEDKKFFDVYSMDFNENHDNDYQSSFFLRYVAKKRSDDSEYYKTYKNVYEHIINTIVIFPETGYANFFGLINDDSDFLGFKKLLSDYKIDITDLVQESVPIENILPNYKENSKELTDLIDNLKKGDNYQITINGGLVSISKDENNEIKAKKLTLRHGSSDIFEYYEESKGTRRLFDLLPLLLFSDKKDRLVLIDEIDQSLHTLLTSKLIKDLFDVKRTANIQFLITTHDVNLLNQELLRGDEILLINKSEETRSSTIKLFSDFKKRADREVISNYLNGEFGAIPKL